MRQTASPARLSVAGAAIDVAAKRAATAAKFWARHRKAVLAAEAALEEHGGDLSKVIKMGDLKALIISRTGRTVKAKTGDGRDMLRAEAEAARRASGITLMPEAEAEAVPCATAGGGGSCPSCGVEHAAGQLEPDENGKLWCECGGRLSDEEDDDDEC
jgi:ferredoxin